jgi:hypothetical protein
MSSDDFALSRSGMSEPQGKCTQRLDVPVPDELYEAVGAMATLQGVPRAEWVRRVLQRELYGSLGMARSLVAGVQPGDGINARHSIGSQG